MASAVDPLQGCQCDVCRPPVAATAIPKTSLPCNVRVDHLREITLRGARRIGRGDFGTYFRLGKYVGVKLVRVAELYRGTVTHLKYQTVLGEYERQLHAYKAGLAPKPHAMVVVRHKGRRYLGITMRFMANGTLAQAYPEAYKDNDHPNYDVVRAIRGNLRSRLQAETGIYHGDLHENNVVRGKRRWYAIDFGLSSYDRKPGRVYSSARYRTAVAA